MAGRLVPASELARFAHCEQAWAFEREFGFGQMDRKALMALVEQARRSEDEGMRAKGAAAEAYLQNVLPSLEHGEAFHHEDARRRMPAPSPLAGIAVLLAMIALAAVLLLILHR